MSAVYFEGKAQLQCNTYNISPNIAFTTNPAIPIFGQSTSISAAFTYSGFAAENNYLTVYPHASVTWSGPSFTTVNTNTISAAPSNITTSYTATINYDLAFDPNPSTSQRVNNCSVTKTISITQPTLSVTNGAQTVPCGNSTPQTYTASVFPGASSYSWTWPSGWSGPATTSSNSATVTPNGSTVGNVKVSITVNGLSLTSAAYPITFAVAPVITILGPNLVCSSGTYAISSPPAGYSITWISSNTNGLSINPSGLATRVNNFSGQVTLSAALNGCGSITIPGVNVVVGSPAPTGISIDASTCPEYYFDAALAPFATSYFWQWNKDPAGTIRTKTTPSSSSGRITLVDGSGTYRIGVRATNSCGQSGFTVRTFTMSCGGSLRSAVSISPNPVSDVLTIEAVPTDSASIGELENPLQSAPKESTLSYTAQLLNAQGTVLKSGRSKGGKIDLDVIDIPIGTYYLHLSNGVETVKSQIAIKH